MNGAEQLLANAHAAGVEICFANPGTTEMPLVAALEGGRLRAVLGLFEGVCTGAADGYGRMRERPAARRPAPGMESGMSAVVASGTGRCPRLCLRVWTSAPYQAAAWSRIASDRARLPRRGMNASPPVAGSANAYLAGFCVE
jgi:hypothetical protein